MDEWVWSIGGMIMTGENWSTGRKAWVVYDWMSMEQQWIGWHNWSALGKICPSSTFSTSNLTWHGPRLNIVPAIRGQQWTSQATMAWLRVHGIWLCSCFAPSLLLNITHRFYVSIMFIICFLVSSSVLPSATIILHCCYNTGRCIFWLVKGIQCLNICTFCVVNVHFTMYVTQ